MRNVHSLARVSLFIVFFIAGLLVGVLGMGYLVQPAIANADDSEPTSAEDEGYPLLDEVQYLLDRVYLRDQPDYQTRQYEAIRGMIRSLNDPNTFFIEPVVAQSESDALSGVYGGIGVLLTRNEQGEFILIPYDGSPARLAGVQDNDRLVAIEDMPVTLDMQADAVDQMMRGEVTEGAGINLTIEKIDGTIETYFIPFDVIRVPSVLWRVLLEDERIGYIRIQSFTARTPEELRDAISSMMASDIDAVVLDLRGNTGGLLQESIQVADIFLSEGDIVIERNNNSEEIERADADVLLPDLPMIILVNNRTASASEVVAGALKDNGRAILVGQQTYGKGTVQQIFGLSDGSSVHITSSEWLTPDDSPIQGVGLTPDVPMIADENGRDVELGEAIRILQNDLNSQ